MSFYAVRTISEKSLVGLFFAESLPHLVVDVSRVASTENCEFFELAGGAIFWRDSGIAVPLREGEGDIPWDRSEMTEGWASALHDPRLEWIPLLATEDVVR
ncbi:MAG TPA: hypothetical protein VHD34_02325 [Xanthobacteraceae bacterium]|nr:hypothetical protein [Xanthobacteraceae bacterium]